MGTCHFYVTFHYDNFEISHVDPGKSNVNAGDIRNQSDIHSTATSSKTADIAFEVNELERKTFESLTSKENDGSNIELNHAPNNDEESDLLLAKAIFAIENENCYKKPLGKSYRPAKKIPRMASLSEPVDVDLRFSHLPAQPSAQYPPSPVSSFDEINNDDIDSLAADIALIKPMIEFINQKKDFIITLVSDSSYLSKFHRRSERIIALKKCSNLKKFAKFAGKEQDIICQRMESHIGKRDFLPYLPFLQHINSEILVEEHTPESIYDIRGKWPLPIKIRSFPNKFDTIKYVILLEIFTEFLMENNCTSYKEASKDLYGSLLPTTHHVNMLLSECVLNSLLIDGLGGDISLQIVEGNLSEQYTHGIMNITDTSLMNDNEFSKLLVDAGGDRVSLPWDNYIEENVP